MPHGDDLSRLLQSIGANVTRLRTRAQLTQAKLAEMIGREPTYLQTIEYGNKAPSLATLLALANALGVSVEALVRDAQPEARGKGRPRLPRGGRSGSKT